MGVDIRDRQLKAKSLSGMSKWNAQRLVRSDFNKFRQSVHLLEEDFESLNVSLKARGENPFFSYIKLATGCFCVALSSIWYLHLILYVLLPQVLGGHVVWGFLNALFQLISKANFYLIDLVVYQLFVGYLMICQMIGCFRFNMRVSSLLCGSYSCRKASPIIRRCSVAFPFIQ